MEKVSKEGEYRPQPTLMTRETHQRLLREKEELKERIGEIRAGLREAAGGFGEWHDSFAFEEGHRQIDMLTNQQIRLLQLLDNVEFIEPNLNTDMVDIGNRVHVEFDDGRKGAFIILGPADYGTREGWLPYTAPFARAVIGHKVGDRVEYEVPDKDQVVEVEIFKIEPGDFE